MIGVMLGLVCILVANVASADTIPRPATPLALRGYPAAKTALPPVIDGHLDDPAWLEAIWSDPFVDIEGNLRPAPTWDTRMKMAWDNTALYVCANLVEPHVWATLTERDAVIYHDDDFEIFLDPDGDNHLYYELEVNALNTVWDLLLIKPYRDGAPAVNAWDIAGLETAVQVNGTLNDPSDKDQGWTVEIAIPWTSLRECAGRAAVPPLPGDRWRVNFSRVDWDLEVVDGQYVKLEHPEHNWVWSPQGLIAMHYPERWGIVEFYETAAAARSAQVTAGDAEHAAAALMQVYYEQRDFEEREHHYADNPDVLDLDAPGVDTSLFDWPPQMTAHAHGFVASTKVGQRGVLNVDHTSRLWWSD